MLVMVICMELPANDFHVSEMRLLSLYHLYHLLLKQKTENDLSFWYQLTEDNLEYFLLNDHGVWYNGEMMNYYTVVNDHLVLALHLATGIAFYKNLIPASLTGFF